ncbi:helix-turn-helix transcriptional regulator [bacterium]|nr:helix-turn-helix transcriptional regulator [bacterium]
MVKAPLDPSVLEYACAMLKLLGHPVRLRIVELLDAHESLSVNQVVFQLQEPQPTISQHLNALKARGLLASERRDGQVFYRIAQPQIYKLLECIRGCRA